jgi:hypothetical protein
VSHPLDGVRLKFKRADQHLDALEEGVRSYLSRNPYRVAGETYPEENRYEVFVRISEYPPAKWSVLIGDAVHNLRSGLDHLVWELAVECLDFTSGLREPARQTGFPITFDNSPKRQRSDAKKIADVGPQAQAIIQHFQPHVTRNPHDPLWLLERLWNIDKHQTLVVGGYLLESSMLAVRLGRTQRIVTSATYGAFEDRTPIASGTLGPGQFESIMQVYDSLAYDVAFGQVPRLGASPNSTDYPFEGLPLVRTLRDIQKHILEKVFPFLANLPLGQGASPPAGL